MTTTESIRNWFLECPSVKTVIGFNTNYLGDEAGECTIYSAPSNLHYTEDITGTISFRGIQTLNFALALQSAYGDDNEHNMEVLNFFTQIKEWMYEQNTLKNFPVITEGEVKSILPSQTEYVSGATADTASYVLPCSLKYWREA